MDAILSKALKEIRPTSKEDKDLRDKVDIFVKRLKMRTDCPIFVGGSFAKKSYLKDIKDIDIFVLFEDSSKDISLELGEILRKMFPDVKTLNGSRDYYQVEYKGLKFEIVPIVKIKKAEEAHNITDVSPLHVRWVTTQKLDADEIRLAKAFAKAAGVYGAESFIQGFSGYTIEILTIHYGGFIGLLKAVSKWKDEMVIDPERQHKNVRFELNASKLNSPLILIDPVEKGRNTAASLSKEKYDVFRQKAKEYLKKPSLDFFREKDFSLDDLSSKAKGRILHVIEGTSNGGKEDVEGCRLLKAYEHLKRSLLENDFPLRESGWDWKKEKVHFWFILDERKLEPFTTRTGPPVRKKEDAERFRKKYGEVTEKSGRLYAKVKRDYILPGELLKALLKESYIKERVKKARLIL